MKYVSLDDIESVLFRYADQDITKIAAEDILDELRCRVQETNRVEDGNDFANHYHDHTMCKYFSRYERQSLCLLYGTNKINTCGAVASDCYAFEKECDDTPPEYLTASEREIPLTTHERQRLRKIFSI